MSTILDFYRDKGLGGGRTFQQIMAFDDFLMERTHDFIQWIFPLPEPSQAQPRNCPVMLPTERETFKTDEVLRKRVREAVARYRMFLDNTHEWRTRHDHNHLRITRVIRFLTLIDMKEEAQHFHNWVLETHPGVPSKTEWYWSEARTEFPGFLGVRS